MANPFARRPTPPANFQAVSNSQNSIQNGQQDPADYAAEMLKRSGGDAKAAFYLACKENGVDVDAYVKQIQMISNPQLVFQQMLLKNPKFQSLMTLFNSAK